MHFFWHMENLVNKIAEADNLKESLSLINERVKKIIRSHYCFKRTRN